MKPKPDNKLFRFFDKFQKVTSDRTISFLLDTFIAVLVAVYLQKVLKAEVFTNVWLGYMFVAVFIVTARFIYLWRKK